MENEDLAKGNLKYTYVHRVAWQFIQCVYRNHVKLSSLQKPVWKTGAVT